MSYKDPWYMETEPLLFKGYLVRKDQMTRESEL